MLEIMIPRDIREYETKFIGPFTMRQAICFVIMLGILYLCNVIQTKLIGMETSSYIPGLVICILPILFGWGKKMFGMNFEDYMRTVFISTYKKPRYRTYRIHNYHEIAIEKMQKEDALANKEKPKKKKKEQLIGKMPYELQSFA